MTPMEKDIEKHLTRGVGKAGGMCLKWVCPGFAGVPDRIILMPGGRIFFVELKRPSGGRISSLQVWWHQKLRELGFQTFVISTNESVTMFLEQIQKTYTGIAFREDEENEISC